MNSENIKAQNKEDYSLYYMGTFDEIEGMLIQDKNTIKRIMKGENV